MLCRPRDAETIAGDVVEMRAAIAAEKGDNERWNLKYVAGGLIDLEFIAQYLQLVHAAEKPEILDTSTARALDKAARLGVLPPEDADVLRPAVRLYQNLTQILRLCLSGPFDPKSAGPGLLSLLARAADVPDFTTLEAHLAETQAQGARELRADIGAGALARFAQFFRGVRRGRCIDRQPHHHDRADAERRADAHGAAMQFGQRLGDRQAQTRAAMDLGELAFHLLERLAEILQRLLRDADAGVLDRDVDVAADDARPHRDAPAVGRELHRIGQQIDDDLLDRAAVGAQADRGFDLGT